MNIYYDTINKQAEMDWYSAQKGIVTIYNFEHWKTHWLKTAEAWQTRCEDEGLKETANHIAAIIRVNR